jgi:tetratricopeptide (TPR) repeat protein
MDQLTAHLDRGWDLAQQGDVRGAEASARQALEIDANAPEVHNLLGYVAALEGEADSAVEHYKNALALDEGYFDAMLNLAEVLVHPLGELDDAIDQCDEAISWAENDEELADAMLIKIDALLAKRDEAAARRAVAALPEGPFESSRYDFLIGRAKYECGDVAGAEKWIDRALERDDHHADAHYYRALIRETHGDYLRSTSAFLRVRQLDELAPLSPGALQPVAFEESVRGALRKLDPALRRFVEQAELFVAPLPGLEVVADGVDPRAPMLLDGLATPDRPGPPCARLFVYQRNLERLVASPTELVDELVATLEHEITATFLEDRRSDPARPKAKHELN